MEEPDKTYQFKPPEPQTRKLKVYHDYYPEGSYYPEIRIAGKYLIDYGFDSGVRIEVKLSWREISIRPVFDEPSV